MQHYIENSNIKHSNSTFISYKNQNITFSDFYHSVSTKSRALKSLNLIEQSKIGIFLSSPIDILEIYFSCIQLNKKPIIFPYEITDQELQEIINKYKIKFIITDWAKKKQIKFIKGTSFFYNQELSSSYGGCGDIEFNKDILDINAIQSLHLTSGSTGFSKLISLTFNNFLNSVKQWHNQINFSILDRYIQCLPLNHIAGLSIIIRSQLQGFETILMDKFNSNKINSEIDAGATLISLVPSMLKRLLDNRSRRPFPRHFRGVILGGDNCPTNLIKQTLESRIPIYKSYGMTETCSGISGFWIQDHPNMLDSVGKPFNETKITIIDTAIEIKGPTITPYNNKPTNGVFKSTDMGYFKKGFLFITGRSDDMVISGGENISLSQIKNILIKHPNIIDAYIDNTPDDNYGTIITAYIETDLENNLTTDDIFSYCKQYISHNKLPQVIEIVEKINYN